ncbi:MAG TPA: amino acid adenylation domain-containing protein [Bacteroidales bacterium]|nr:amino acid adenylation domain-containing protein [Bacteroidales bacterium]
MEEVKISPIQKHFWLLQKVYKVNTSYNIPVVLKISGVHDHNALEYALKALVLRHEALRIRFVESENEVFVRVISEEDIKLNIEKVFVGKPFTDNEVSGEIMNEIHRIFDLTEWPVFRVKLFIFSNNISVLTIVFHHIIVDLRSKEIFAADFSEFYNSFKSDYQPGMSSMPEKYSDYLLRYDTWLKSDEADRMRSEWQKYIHQAPGLLEIPTDFPRPRINTPDGKRKHFTLDRGLYKRSLEFAAANSVKDFAFFLSAYAILLHRLSGQNNFLIGVPFTNRRNDEQGQTFGCFVNIVPVNVSFDDNITAIELLRQIRYSLLRIHRMQEIPFLTLNELLKNDSGNPIFQAGFTFEPPVNLKLKDCDVEPLVVERKGAQLELFLTLWEQNDTLNGFMEYSTLLYRDDTALHYIDLYRQVIKSFLMNPELPVSELDIITDEEAAMIMEWNNTDHDYTRNICIHQKFEQQVLKTPDSPAILYENKTISYSVFNSHANKLANYLISMGVKTDDIVCVCMERSAELMIAIFSIHKAGAAYLPVDPEYPAERLGMILSDARPVFILTNKRSDKNLPDGNHRIYLDNIMNSPYSGNDKNPDSGVASSNLAYLIYTSGSTGVPKGVMIEHHSVINKLEWMQFRHPLKDSDTILLKTPVTFDVSVWELFWWMFNGAKMAILPPGGEKEPGVIIEEIASKKVTTIVFVPSMFSPFVGYAKARNSQHRLRSLKWIIQIGEPLTPQLVNSFNELLTPEFNPLMVNTYGPTEATVAVSWYDCPKEKDIKKIYIGRPIFNTKLLVLNKRNKLQPSGVPGELVITGVNLSRGYLNRPELNSERFITFLYPDGRYLRGYKTGDLVKLCRDGNIDFIGRTDSQVKIRGFRIELGEIESKLLEYPAVKSAAVVVREKSPENKFIAGFVVLKDKGTVTTDELRKYLLSKIPDYMVPGIITILESMPLNTSGKIDRKALPDTQPAFSDKSAEHASSVERSLQEIWKETLGTDEVGLTHNFFDVGGNSILAVHMVNLIKQKLNVNIEPLNVMEHPSIRSLAGFISGIPVPDARNVRKQDFAALQQRRNQLLRKA